MSYMSELDAETRQEYLSDVSTEELVEELAKREGVLQYKALPDGAYNIRIAVADDDDRFPPTWSNHSASGPARVLVVTGEAPK